MTTLSSVDAAIFETFVVPRYMQFFGDLVLESIVDAEDAQVVHLQCRTGYPDRGIARKLPRAHLYGCDASPAAIELARAKAATMPDMVADYRVESLPVSLPAAAFSHGYALHPLGAPEERRRLFAELARLIAPRGQALVAMPLRGSFQEIADILREYALHRESDGLSSSVEAAVHVRPTEEQFVAELTQAGFDFVEITTRAATLTFRSSRDFFEDPTTRIMLLPEFRKNLGFADGDPAWGYLRDAIDKYWSDASFELSVNVGCVTGRRIV